MEVENKNQHNEYSPGYGEMKDIINGEDIQHLQFSEFSEGHGSIYGTLKNGKIFKLHITELLKMMNEFNFSLYKGSGSVIDCTLKVNWGSTNDLRNKTNFLYKSNSNEYRRDGNTPAKVNYVIKKGKEENTTFEEHRMGSIRPGGKTIPYYSGQIVIIKPNDLKNL